MKTPEEIKKGLECCLNAGELDFVCGECPYDEAGSECDGLYRDALAYIQQLEEKYKHAMENAKILSDAVTKLERERDFLLKYFTDSHWAACDICKHEPETHDINDCAHIRKVGLPCFEWRGLPEDDHGR